MSLKSRYTPRCRIWVRTDKAHSEQNESAFGLLATKPEPDAAAAAKADPDDWLKDSETLAEAVAYAEPVKSGAQPYVLDRQYETNARNAARQQAALAGARLANLINEALK